MSNKYRVEQLTSHHIHRYTNVRPKDIGLWVYIIDGRAYGFATTKEGAIAKAEAAVGTL
jgi:hypothetical protein